jgi:3-carboxy-cis,cis-muconate cycloisomerase
LLDGIFARGRTASAVGDAALLQAMLDVEAALARAWARAGEIPDDAAAVISEACQAGRFDPAQLGREAARHAQPVVGLVAALRDAVGAPHAAHVHRGATSQDVLDTALMLVARRALAPLLADLAAAADAAAAHAGAHLDTPIAGRTLLQHAVATTFGLKATGWAFALDEAHDGLTRVRESVLAVQLGGPVGSLHAPEVVADLAARLELAAPVIPWHAHRRRPAELAAALGVAAGTAAKVARDVVLLAQDEVGEVREGGDAGAGRSSSMAHKRNPVAAISALACAARVPGLVATVLSGMDGEHERSAGSWQAEWLTSRDLLTTSGAAAAWIAELLGGLEIDAGRMAANLARGPASSGDLQAAHNAAARALAVRQGRRAR